MGFLEEVDGVAAGVADDDLGVLARSLGFLDKLLPALLGEGGDDAADDLAVVGGSQADVGVEDGLFDFLDHAALPRLDGDGLGVRGVDRGDLEKGSGGSVIVHHHIVENGGRGLPEAVGLEVLLEEIHGVLHLAFGNGQDLFCSVSQHVFILFNLLYVYQGADLFAGDELGEVAGLVHIEDNYRHVALLAEGECCGVHDL